VTDRSESRAAAAIERVWRNEAARVIARLTRLTRDLGLAEELAQDALVAALEKWPETGVPDNPGAWLVTTGKNRALDRLRQHKLVEQKHREIGAISESRPEPSSLEDAMGEDIGDDLLRLIFIACHPVLLMDAQVSLTLRMVGGLSTDEIARAFLTASPTIAQRIVRAKRTLADAQAEFVVPRGEALAARIGAVLRVIYLVFNEGYAATGGDDVIRAELCERALHLGRLMLSLVPYEPEVLGLVALMELQASRAAARVDADGQPVLLLEQDRSRWDQAAITRGLGALTRAHLLGRRGPYVLQAEIAACHARAQHAEDTDWARIAARYAELAALTPSPVIELNRAVAVSMADGPAAGLALLDQLAAEPALSNYHLLPAARADMLDKLGRSAEARAEFERAAAMATHPRDRVLLLERAARCRA
jgi:predicted RNA polymerase sigma factor